MVLFFMLIGCASSTAQRSISLAESLDLANCGFGEFRGFGTGKSEDEALSVARSNLAMQINSSVKVSAKYRQSQQVFNGEENLDSKYESELVVEAALLNAHDARILRVERRASEVGTVVCMAKIDAAKGFLERQRLVADSLELASNIALNTEHPRHKNEAWQRTQALYNDFMKIQYLLEGWGVKSPYSVDEIYSKTRENYKNYCRNVKIFWQDTGNECSNAVFAMLSKKIKIEKSRCSNGLSLSFNCSEKCKSSSFGIECSFEPSLSIESCGGESYSLLKVQTPATGNDMYSEAKAKERLVENLPKATFFNEWEMEMREWVPRCAD
jgi:hypothetical protein